MPPIPLKLESTFKRRLKKKTTAQQGAILECVARLSENTRHPGLQTHRVQGKAGVFEAYVDAGNRVTFHYDQGTIVLRNHCSHDILGRNP
jgi:hypothetical protein